MASVCLETLWQNKLFSLGWSETAAIRLIRKWAPSTIASYNKALQKLNLFCVTKGGTLHDLNESTLAEYMCTLAGKSDHPKSVLSTILSALMCYTDAMSCKPIVTPNVNALMDGLIKSGTTKPMKRSMVMLVEKFSQLFLSWPGNYLMELELLWLKCITLLAITAMMRPSDAVPLARIYDKKDKEFKQTFLSTKNIQLHADGSMTVIFHGIKNNYKHEGFEVNLPPASNP